MCPPTVLMCVATVLMYVATVLWTYCINVCRYCVSVKGLSVGVGTLLMCILVPLVILGAIDMSVCTFYIFSYSGSTCR